MSAKTRIHDILEGARHSDRTADLVQTFILTLIILNVGAMIFESVRAVYIEQPLLFYWFEVVSVAIFSVEYVLRLWSCTAISNYHGRFTGRLKFAVTPLALVDLFAILPFYLPFVGVNLLFLRAIRLFRFFRLAKLARYSESLRTLGRVLFEKKEELTIAFLLLTLTLIFSSVLMYFAESEAQPRYFSSIPAAMWWAVMTLTTVGDVRPITVVGKLVASLVAILGIGVFAIPTAILGSGFLEQHARRRGSQKCPHCGKDLTI
jgi:voltage-gated potassium channel